MNDLFEVIMPLCGLCLSSEYPDACNLNLYENGGDAVGWHADDEPLFQGMHQDIRIISLSLGQDRTFELKRNWPEKDEGGECFEVALGNGDVMTMEGMTQKHYQHRVPPADNVVGPRINLTWRWVLKHDDDCPRA